MPCRMTVVACELSFRAGLVPDWARLVSYWYLERKRKAISIPAYDVQPDLAGSLNDLGNRLLALGHREPALSIILLSPGRHSSALSLAPASPWSSIVHRQVATRRDFGLWLTSS